MTDYTARNVLLKDSSGNYLIPYTEKADLSLGNLNSAGKAYVAIKGYNSSATYSLNEVVMTVVSGSVLFYRSLVDNNMASLSDTTKWSEVELGGGSVDIDNSTITLNSNDEIQTVGVIDNRSGSTLKLWTGTRSQYNAIQNKDANTLYNITDDTGDLGTFANTDLSNLSNTGEAHFVNPALTNSPYTTNRILEIPQDIKLELNNGTLTLKAGSKVYVPNGANVFDEIAIQSDASANLVWAPNSTNAIFVRENGTLTSIGIGWSNSDWWSGSNPTITKQYGYRYDTANNIIQTTNDTGSTWSGKCSFPICLVTSDANQKISSIDQIFNGFGYIGSTVFALPGVKVQCANGRNEDGTYNSSVYTISTVFTTTIAANWGTFDVILTQDYLNEWPNVIRGSIGTRYNSENNYYEVYDAGGSKWVQLPKQLAIAKLKSDTTSPYKITSLKPYTVDSVANSNASNFSQAGRSYLSGLGMPDTANAQFVSNSFATSTNFTAPASGWYCCRATSTTTSGNMMLFIAAINSSGAVVPPYNGGTFPAISTSGTARQVLLPVNVGQRIQVQYFNASLSGDAYCGLWFIPAKGEN